MMLRYSALIVLIGAFTYCPAQRLSIGMFGGVSHYFGELNQNTFYLDGLQPAAGGLIRYQPSPYLGIRFGVTATTLSGSDAEFPNATPAQRIRNLSFRSFLVEAALLLEWNIIGYDAEYERFSPYLFVGVAGFHYNPKARYKGEWYELQPLTTEGQGTSAFPNRKPYSLYQVAFPFGMGFHFGLGSGVTLSLEGGLRYLLTDYLDDVSQTYVNASVLILERGQESYYLSNRTGEVLPQPLDLGNNDLRGNPENTDWYGFTGLTLTYTLGAGGGVHRKKGCDYSM